MRTSTPKLVCLSLLLAGLFGLSAKAQTTVVYADPLGNPNAITVLYSFPMLQSSAENTANYGLINSSNSAVIPISSATLATDQVTVRLRLGASLQLYTNYTLTVANVKDANLGFISPNPTVANFWFGGNPNMPTYTFDDGRVPSTTWLSSNAVDTAGNGRNPYLSVTNVGGLNNSGMLILTANPVAPGRVGGVPLGQAFGQWHIADLVNGAAITNLMLAFDMFYGNGTGGNTQSRYTDAAHAGANGVLFHWGPGLNPNGVDQYTGGASSWGSGLDVTFRIYNSAPNTPGINIYYGGTSGAGANTPTAANPYLDYFTGNFVNTWPNNTTDPSQIGFSSNYTHVVLNVLVTNSLTVTNAVISLACSNAWNGLTNIYNSLVIPNFNMARAAQPMAFTGTDGAGGHSDGFLDNVDFTINGAHIIGSLPVGPVGITRQPASQTNVENVHVTFSVGVTGAPPTLFQWYSNSVAIANATNASYTTPLTLYSTMNGAMYSVTVSNDFSYAISSNALLTIIKDTNGVQVASVGSTDGNSIGVTFSGYVDLASAGTPANYQVNGGAVSVIAADTRTSFANFGNPEVNYTPSYLKTVRLLLGSTVSGGYTVTIKSNVLSRTGLQVNWNNGQQRGFDTNFVGQVLGLSDGDLGSPGSDPAAPGQAFSGGSNLVEVVAGGSNLMPIGGTGTDAGNFAYSTTPRTGNFDVMASLNFETPTAPTAKAGLMVRPNPTDASSPAIAIKVFPQSGNNNFDTPFRPGEGYSPVSWNVLGSPASGNQGAYWSTTGKNWMRIRSLGGTYYGYVSGDGAAWTLLGQVTPSTSAFPYPTSEYVGLFACAANNDGRLCEADFSNWGVVSFPSAVLALTTNLPAGVTTNADSQVTFSIGATLTGPAASELVYQWQRAEPSSPSVFNDIYGANARTYTTPFLTTADNGAKYRVVAFAGDITTGRSTNSATLTLTVNPDTTPPYMVSAYADATFQQVTINFNKPMDNNSLGNLANYTLVNATNASDVVMLNSVTPISADSGAHYLVAQLALSSKLVPGVQYTLTVRNVLDASANNINNTVVVGGKQRIVTGWALAYGYLKFERYQGPLYPNGNGTYTGPLDGSPGGLLLGSSLEYSKLTANTPDNTQLITISAFPSGASFTSPGTTTAGDVFDFGGRISGFFIPPTNGNYQFYIRGNDGNALWVSGDSTIPDPTSTLAKAVDNEGFGSGRSWLYSITNIANAAVNGNYSDSSPISMTAGQLYGLAACYQQGNGGSCIEFSWGLPGAATLWDGTSVNSSLDANYRTYAGMVTNTYNIRGANIATYIDPDLSTITATGPTNVTVRAGNNTIFSVSAAAVLSMAPGSYPEPVAYQWIRNGINITGATGSSYTTPVLLSADSNAVFSVLVTVPGVSFLSVSNSAVVSVLPPLPVQVVSASGFGSSIGIQFNQAMDPVSVVNAANYTSVSGGLIVTSVVLQPDGRTVALKLNGPLSPPTFSVTLNNVQGLGANPITPNTIVTGNVPFPQLTAMDIGVGTNAAPPGVLQTNASLTNVTFNVNYPGFAFMATDGVFQVQASGLGFGTNNFGANSFIGNSYQDGLNFISEPRTNDFDIKVRLEYLGASNPQVGPSDARAKAGLMMRAGLYPTNLEFMIAVEPAYAPTAADGSGNGYNGVTLLRRQTNSDAVTTLSNNPNPPVLGNTANSMYPVWLRMRRTGSSFYFYTGDDGTNWYICGRATAQTAWPSTVYVGLATTAANMSSYTQARFSGYGDFVAPAHQQVLLIGMDNNVTGAAAVDTAAGNPNEPSKWLSADNYMYNLFRSLGYSVLVVADATSRYEDCIGMALIYWQGTSSSGNFNQYPGNAGGSPNTFTWAPVPILACKDSTMYKMGFAAQSSDVGHSSQTQLTIIHTNNPIVKGAYLTNQTLTVNNSAQYFAYCLTNNPGGRSGAGSGLAPGFTAVATIPGNPSQAVVFYADKGPIGQWQPIANGGTAAGSTATNYFAHRRVGLWLGDNGGNPAGSFETATGDGLFLLTNAINWAIAVNEPPGITNQPASVAVVTGTTATFSVSVGGPGPFTYQWKRISGGATNSVGGNYPDYTTPATVLADSGSQFYVIVTGLYGSVTSSAATLTVQTPVAITGNPQNQTNYTGSTVTFTVAATGTSLTYQWFSNTVAIAGATGASYTTPPLTAAANGAQYSVKVSNLVSSQTSTSATLTVLPGTQTGISGFVRIDSSHFSINWSNGSASSVLLSSTNVALGVTNWTPVVTNPTLPYTIIVNPNAPGWFYRVKQ